MRPPFQLLWAGRRLLPGLFAQSPCWGALSWRTAHSEVVVDFCRLLEALVSFLDFSDKEANSAMGLLTDLALEER